ncbi:MAG: restriction endonuclease subunit S [Desulfobacterales bacterium]
MRDEWQVKALGEICHVVGGGTPSKQNAAFYEGDIPWATVRDMKEEVLSHTEFRISKEAVRHSSTNIIPAGNVVIATRVGLGKVCLLNQDTAINQDLRGVIPKVSGLDTRYLLRWFQSISNTIESEGTGATVKGVKLPFIKSLKIPVPPLDEQKRIVAILDEAFAGIEKAVANTEKNLANARELFDSYSSSAFREREQRWNRERFGNVCGFVRGPFGGSLKKSFFVSDGYAVYEQQHAINDQFSFVRYFIDAKKFEEMARFELKPGDLIMSCSGTMGRVAIAPDKLKRGIINQALLKLTPSSKVDAHFLKLWMEQESFINEIKKHSQGVAIKNVASVKVLKEIEVPCPPIEEQRALVERLKYHSDRADELKFIYQQKLTALSELKQSLLQKAFSGELTAKDSNTAKEAAA